MKNLFLENEDSDDLEWLKSIYSEMYSEPYEEVIRIHTQNFSDPIEELRYDHYGMTVYEIDGERYAITEESGMDDVIRDYYQDLLDDIGYDNLGINMYYYVTITETDKRIMSGEEADYIVSDMSDEELLEHSGLDGEHEELEDLMSEINNDIDDLTEELDELNDELETMEKEIDDWDSKDIEEYKFKIDEVEVKIQDKKQEYSDAERRIEEIMDEAVEQVRSDYYDDFYDCLGDPIDCLVNQRGLYSSVDDLIKYNIVMVDEGAIVDDLVINGSYGDVSSYDGDYHEIKDSEGTRWVLVRVD